MPGLPVGTARDLPPEMDIRREPEDREFSPGGEIVLAGHFDPHMLLPLFCVQSASRLADLHGPPGVPIHHLATGLAQRRIKSTVLGGLYGGPDLYVRSDPLSAAIYRRRGTRAFTLTGFRLERAAILKRLKQIRPAIIHAHWTMEAARAVADWDGPKILTVHDAVYDYAQLSCDWRPGSIAYWSRWVVNTLAVLKRFDHIIAVSPFVETYLRYRHRFRGEIRVIPNGIPPLPAGMNPVHTFPKAGRVTFGCYGGPGRLKNVITAIRAFRMVSSAVPGSRLVIFGPGWQDLRTQHDKSLIETRGHVSHQAFLRALAAEIDIWVHTSRIEAHPITICEAIQAGCPVIAGRASGGVAWTLDYGRAGILVDIEDSARVAEAMTALATDRNKATALVSYGQKMILDRFSPQRIVDLHLDYYQDVISNWKKNKA
jgi:L-malate glycosyltransferase